MTDDQLVALLTIMLLTNKTHRLYATADPTDALLKVIKLSREIVIASKSS